MSDKLTVLTEESTGYVHIEEVHYDEPELEPRIYKMVEYGFEAIN